MPSPPRDRISTNKPRFTYDGVDYFGPFEVKQERSRVKGYSCLFTYHFIRAAYVKIVHA